MARDMLGGKLVLELILIHHLVSCGPDKTTRKSCTDTPVTGGHTISMEARLTDPLFKSQFRAYHQSQSQETKPEVIRFSPLALSEEFHHSKSNSKLM